MTFAGPSHQAYVQPLYEELEEPSYTRRPRRLPLLAGTEEEANDPRLEPRYAPRVPKWTKTEPEVEGFFQVRPAGASEYMVVKVRRNAQGVLEFGMLAVAWRRVDLHHGALEWADMRIPDPRS